MQGHGFIYMIFAQVIFFIVTLILILWLVKSRQSFNSVKQILDRRLAKGEITKKEYKDLLVVMGV